jgi:hypothetical protein
LEDFVSNYFGIKIMFQPIEFPTFALERPTQDIFFEVIAPLEMKCMLERHVLLAQIDVVKFKAPIHDFLNYLYPGQKCILLTVLPLVLDTMKNDPFVQIILDLIDIRLIIIIPVIMLRNGSYVMLQIKQFFNNLFPDIITKLDDWIQALSLIIELLNPVIGYMCERWNLMSV